MDTIFPIILFLATASPKKEPDLPQKSRPVLLVQANPTELHQGTPLVLSLYLAHNASVPTISSGTDASETGPITLGSIKLGTTVFRYDASNKKINDTWPFTSIPRHQGPITLSPQSPPLLLSQHVLSGEQTSKIRPATYVVQAWFDTQNDNKNSTWAGNAAGGTLIQISAPPPTPSASEECEKALGTREYYLALNQDKKALDVLDTFLTQVSKSAATKCWATRAKLHEKAGELRAARDAYCNAGRAGADDAASAHLKSPGTPARPSVGRLPYMERCHEYTKQLALPATNDGEP